jgi:hypothetical protein
MDRKGVGFWTIVKIILAVAMGGVILYFVLSAREAGAEITDPAGLLGNTDGAGKKDIRDPCPCTADNIRRQYQGDAYCVSTQDQSEFEQYMDQFEESEATQKRLSQGLLLLDESNQSISQEITLYSAEFCRKAILNTGWPNR